MTPSFGGKRTLAKDRKMLAGNPNPSSPCADLLQVMGQNSGRTGGLCKPAHVTDGVPAIPPIGLAALPRVDCTIRFTRR